MAKNVRGFLIFGLLFFIVMNSFSQSFNMNNYTLFSWLSFKSSTVSGTSTKYVVLSDVIAGKANNGDIIYYIAHSNEYGNAALGLDMTELQITQLRQIKNNNDNQLIFFTRTGTNNNNYHFIVDRIMPMKEVIGFSKNELPESVSYEDCYNAVSSYLKTGKVDPEHIVLDKVNKAKNDTMLAEAMHSVEEERQAELRKKQLAEERDARNEARDRMRLLRSVTVFGGYKPCFGTENSLSLSYNKIAVFGDIDDSYNNYSVSSGNNPVMKAAGIHKIELISDADIRDLLREIRRYTGLSSDLDSKTCIFFLSRSTQNDKYRLIEYILYSDIVPGASFASQYDAETLDKWILENADK